LELTLFGWNHSIEELFAPFAGEHIVPGRVTLEYKHIYRLQTTGGEVLAQVAGKMRYQASGRVDFPVVGDWVAAVWDEGEGRAVIQAILPRQSKFSRKVAGSRTEEQVVAANVDTVFLVSALNQEFNVRRIERYLATAWESGANPVIVLNKADLCTDVQELVREAAAVAPGVPIHAVSCTENRGLDALRPYLREPGKTTAVLGSSGVGKSTLINRFMGREVGRVTAVREGDDRGRHTTTHRELMLMPSGGLIIDTPGMRELALWETDDGVRDTFADIESLAGQCRFGDCQHESEPHCAVRNAVREGSIDPGRYESYLKLQKELAFLAGKTQLDVRLARKDREKKLGKLIKEVTKKHH
jgi:ribosome biogenesis GTPase / thiamine phosphate phosphatase